MIAFVFLSNISHAHGLRRKQMSIPWIDKDYSYIEVFRKAYNNSELFKMDYLNTLRDAEIRRDYNLGSMKHIDHLIQLDQKPNIGLKEAKCELYKITISFSPLSKMI